MTHFAEARILVVDDEPDVLESYRLVFKEIVSSPVDEFATLAAELFEPVGQTPRTQTTIAAVDLYRQGEDALRHIENRSCDGSYYPVAFIDMRMPPGIDGLETAKKLRQLSPDMNIVVVTGYSDRPPQKIALEIGGSDRFFYLVKPFNPDELLQLTVALVSRWQAEREVARRLASKVAELNVSNAALFEAEAKVKQLKEQVDQLRRMATTANLLDNAAVHKAVHPRPVQKADDPEEPSPESLALAFIEGHAAFDRPHGLGLCPYSAVNEPELFSSFIAGYRSRQERGA